MSGTNKSMELMDLRKQFFQSKGLRARKRSAKQKMALDQGSEVIILGKELFMCPVCRKEFSRFCSAKSHLFKHTGIKPFKCLDPACEKYFSETGNRN